MQPRLKSLELHGYKTFASRTEFQFPEMITAIVGPNGSGKSNIADALRWVLGEQSYSLLRGRKTEDMIFAGSEQRARAGMASATITFDNEDGWLPIDFTEVAITRRAYRDGNNEYLLNGQRVRLREISELLAQSGLAERTYTIIGQGLVDAALALKPEERRRLFEEAAGIGLYRSRREEALNRLESTRRNLERVQDILAELEPRILSLEKQARRAMEYERVRSDLRELLRDWYGYQWHSSQKELTHAREVVRVQEQRLEQAQLHYEEVSQRVQVFRRRTNEIREKLNGWYAESAELHSQRERASRDIAILEERQLSYQTQRQNYLAEIGRIEDELSGLTEKNSYLDRERSKIQIVLQEAQQQAEGARKAYQERLQQRDQAEKSLRDIRQKLVAVETRLIQQKAQRDEIVHRQAEQEKGIQTSITAVTQKQEEVEKLQKIVASLNQQRETADHVRQKATLDLENHRERLEKLEAERRQVSELSNKLVMEQTHLRIQLDALEQAEKTHTGLADGAKTILNAVRQGQVKGKFTSLNSILEVPIEYEAAIAAALGEYLDILFADSGSDTEQALSLLDQSEKGRAALLPLEWVDHAIGPATPDLEGCLGSAASLVVADETIRPAVNLLLGRALVVSNRSVARRVLQSVPEFSRVITLKGEVFSSDGVILAGRETRGTALSRPRQKRELTQQIDQLEQKAAINRDELNRLETQLKNTRNESLTLEAKVREANKEFEQKRESAQSSLLQLDQIQHQLDWQRNQNKSLTSQLQRAQEQLETVKREVTKNETSQQELRDELRQASAVTRELAVDELQAQSVHWEKAAAVAERAAQEFEGRLLENQQTITKQQSQRVTLTERYDALGTNLEALENEHQELLSTEAELIAQIDQLSTKIKPAETEIQQSEREYTQLQEIENAAQQALNVAERYLNQAQMESTRQWDNVTSLHRRIEDDFGLVALEYDQDIAGQSPLPLEGMVEQLPNVAQVPPDLETNIARLRGQLRRMGPVNPEAQAEYEEVRQRYDFMTSQVTDLHTADHDLRQVIAELDELMKREFRRTFEAVADEFKGLFTRLFGGGSAKLILTEADNPNDTGIEIETRLPGRREQGLSLLSGGERSLTASALVFSLLKVSPTPFCVLDEVDAMLDEANVGRFRELLRELSGFTQFIVITHNRNTVQAAGVIYGVTMGRDSASQVISLKMDEVSDDLVK